jgi:PAS domain S-box-containing protein
MIFISHGGRVVYANERCEELLGYAREEFYSRDFEFLSLFAPESLDSMKTLFDRHSKGEEVEPCESTLVAKGGGRIDSILTTSSIDFAGERAILTIVTDITERKETEAALRKSEASLAEAQRIGRLGNWDWDITGNRLAWSDEIYRIFGLEPKQFGATYDAFLDAVHPGDREFVVRSVNEALYEGRPYSIDHRIVLSDGTERIVHEQAEVFRNEFGEPVRMVGTVQDITDRRHAEDQIRRQNAVLNGINRVFQETLTCETEEEVARTCLDVAKELTSSSFGFIGELNRAGRFDAIALDDPGWDACSIPRTDASAMVKDMGIRGIWSKVVMDGASLIANDPSTHPDRVGIPEGHPELTSFLGVPLKRAGQTTGMIGLANKESGYCPADQQDIEALSVAFMEAINRMRVEGKFRQLLESAPDATVVVDGEGKIVLLNAQAEGLFGYAREELLGEDIETLIPSRFQATHTTKRASYQADPRTRPMGVGMELCARRKDGTEFPVEVSLSPIETEDGTLVSSAVRDITERKQAEEELIRAEKLAGIGTLASGVAHEVNNPLSGILGYAEAILDEEDPDTVRSYAEKIADSAERASEVVRWLSEYSRMGKDTNLTDIDLNAVLSEASEAVRLQRGSADIDLVIHRGEIPLLMGNRAELLQVIVNLLNNAADAMPEGGRITLSTESLDGWVQVAVADTGVGIPEEVKDRIFDPFFTTKEVGEGTGLGLYIISMIMAKHHGTIDIQSAEGEGTTVTLGFPERGESPGGPD